MAADRATSVADTPGSTDAAKGFPSPHVATAPPVNRVITHRGAVIGLLLGFPRTSDVALSYKTALTGDR
jgi:hypothetical protein